MTVDKYSRSVSMRCSTCGGTQFEHETDLGLIRCAGCDRTFTRDELIRENGELIDNQIGEIAADLVKDTREQIRKAFSGSKQIKPR